MGRGADELAQCFSILLCGYLGGFGKSAGGQLLTIEDVGQIMNGETGMPLTFNEARQILT